MGPAHSSVVNKTQKKICVLTFNEADLLYHTYTNLYILLPGETKVVEAIPHPVGLKLAIIYHTNDEVCQRLLYRRWSVKNDAVVEVSAVDSSGMIDISGINESALERSELSTIEEKSATTFARIVQALTQESSVVMPSKQQRQAARSSVALTAEKQAAIATGGVGSTTPVASPAGGSSTSSGNGKPQQGHGRGSFIGNVELMLPGSPFI